MATPLCVCGVTMWQAGGRCAPARRIQTGSIGCKDIRTTGCRRPLCPAGRPAWIPLGSIGIRRSPVILFPEQLRAPNPPSTDPVGIHILGNEPVIGLQADAPPDRGKGSVQYGSRWDLDPVHRTRSSGSSTDSTILMPSVKVLNRSHLDRISWILVHHLFPENFTFLFS